MERPRRVELGLIRSFEHITAQMLRTSVIYPRHLFVKLAADLLIHSN